jgi:hypothetical protein
MDVPLFVVTNRPAAIDQRSEPVLTAQQLIPGAYDRNTLTYRQPGFMGGPAFGSDGIPAGPSSMDEETTLQRGREGGRLRHVR